MKLRSPLGAEFLLCLLVHFNRYLCDTHLLRQLFNFSAGKAKWIEATDCNSVFRRFDSDCPLLINYELQITNYELEEDFRYS